jgi:hypothetical protein
MSQGGPTVFLDDIGRPIVTEFLRAPLHVLPSESGCVIDCDTCTVRGAACADCVVSVMLGGPPETVEPEEERALGVLAGMGLVPPLLMTPPAATSPGASPPGGPAVEPG